MNETANNKRTGILWLGRMIVGRNYRVRETELALRVAASRPVYALDHTDALAGLRPAITDKLRMRVQLIRSRFETLESGPFTRFRMPVAAATGPTWAEAAAAYNERRVREALKRFVCDAVYLSSPFFFMPPVKRDYRLHFDVIDNFHDQWPDTRTGRARRAFHARVMQRADTVSASSLQLCEYVERIAKRTADYVPNGVDTQAMKASMAGAAEIRAKYELQGRFVIGFIGNHTMPFYGLERLVRAFVAARAAKPELALLVVGPDSDRALKYCRGAQDGVRIVGPVPPSVVGAYFHACDAGAHPYDVRPQTHDAMALNVLEFSACGKPVLSNPLREFQRLALPNVRFTADDSTATWTAALADPASFAAFDAAETQRRLAEFDWDLSARRLLASMYGGADAPS